jgi:hypothetical protein
MATYTPRNGDILSDRHALRSAASSNGLTSVKLTKIRDALDAEARPIIIAWDEIGQRSALRDAEEKPIVATNEKGPLQWILTGTPVYALDPEKAEAARAEMNALDAAAESTFTAPQLTAADLAWISATDPAIDIGPALARFSEGIE